jgi:hypothetical protein
LFHLDIEPLCPMSGLIGGGRSDDPGHYLLSLCAPVKRMQRPGIALPSVEGRV